MSEMLKWLAMKLIDARVAFAIGMQADGKWVVSVERDEDSKRLGAWIAEWKRTNEASC